MEDWRRTAGDGEGPTRDWGGSRKDGQCHRDMGEAPRRAERGQSESAAEDWEDTRED